MIKDRLLVNDDKTEFLVLQLILVILVIMILVLQLHDSSIVRSQPIVKTLGGSNGFSTKNFD